MKIIKDIILKNKETNNLIVIREVLLDYVIVINLQVGFIDRGNFDHWVIVENERRLCISREKIEEEYIMAESEDVAKEIVRQEVATAIVRDRNSG